MASERRLVDANVIEERVKICDQPAWMVVRDAPTVDAVEVVRCKDCIYYHKKLGIGFGQCSKCTLMPYPEDFCSYGERKDNERKAD